MARIQSSSVSPQSPNPHRCHGSHRVPKNLQPKGTLFQRETRFQNRPTKKSPCCHFAGEEQSSALTYMPRHPRKKPPMRPQLPPAGDVKEKRFHNRHGCNHADKPCSAQTAWEVAIALRILAVCEETLRYPRRRSRRSAP